MTRTVDDSMYQMAGGLSLMQLAITMAIVSYYHDPQFSMYTTQLLNTTTKQMEVEVEDFFWWRNLSTTVCVVPKTGLVSDLWIKSRSLASVDRK